MPKKITISAEFGLGQFVYLKTDPDQHKRLIIGIIVSAKDHTYQLSCGTEFTEHYEVELSAEKDVIGE